MRRAVLKALGLVGLPTAASPARTLSAPTFWDLYFSDALLRMARSADGWNCTATVSGSGLVVRDLLQPQAQESVRVAAAALRAYDDSGDPRFDLFAALNMSVDAASLAVAQGRYPYRTAPPYAPMRMAEVMADLRQASPGQLRVAELAAWLRAAMDAPGALTDQRITVAAWFLGERRDGAGAGALIDLLDRVGPARVSSGASEAAYAGLWKIADGATLAPLCAQMERASETARWKYARLFERLLSTDTMLSSSQLGSDYARPGYWHALVGRERLAEPAAWKSMQVRALRWELRALQGRRLAKAEASTELARLLAADDVAAVRRAASTSPR